MRILDLQDSALTYEDRVLGVLYLAQALSESDLYTFSRIPRKALKNTLAVLSQDKRQEWVVVKPGWKGQPVYFLTQSGISHLERSKLVVLDYHKAQDVSISSRAFLNEMLGQIVRQNRHTLLSWEYRADAVYSLEQQFARLPAKEKRNVEKIPVPDARLQTPQDSYWLEADWGLWSRRNKILLYKATLPLLDATARHVLWMSHTESRRNALQAFWTAQAIPEMDMRFFVTRKKESLRLE